MTSAETEANRRAWLQSVFAGGIGYADPLESGVSSGVSFEQFPDALRPALLRYVKGDPSVPFLLTSRNPTSGITVWYACTQGDLEARVLRAELEAFIGPSFATFEDQGATFPDPDPLLQRLSAQSLHVIRFYANKPGTVLNRWGRYWETVQLRPVRVQQERRSLAQLRADLDTALVAQNESAARTAVATLREQHGLSAENRVFLEIRIDAAFGRWSRILEHPQWSQLLELRLPPETYGDLWEALYEVYLRPVEAQGDADRLLSVYAETVRPRAGPLLKGRGRSRRPAALKGLLLDALGSTTPSATLCQELLDGVGVIAFGGAGLGLAQRILALSTPNTLEQAAGEMDAERYEQGFALLWDLPDSLDSLLRLLRCAKEIADPERAARVLQRADSASTELREAIQSMRARLWNDVATLATIQVTDTTTENIIQAQASAVETDEVAQWREVARSGDAGLLLNDEAMRLRLQAAIEEHALDDGSSFELLYPIWFEWTIERTPADVRLVPLYHCFIESLRVRDRYGDTELELIRLAALRIVDSGPSTEAYRSLLATLFAIFNQVRSPATMRWALDLTDSLAVAPCRSIEDFTRWRTVVLDAAASWFGRLGAAQKALAALLAQEAGFALPETRAAHESAEAAPPPLNVRVLLYSLDRHALERATTSLTSIFPQARFDLNDDQVCTPRLKQLAARADWIVFVTAVATHSAFYCVQNALRKDAVLVPLKGTGTSRMIECVVLKSRELAV